jgi:lipopolysaccharide transport system ATP-binding protein
MDSIIKVSDLSKQYRIGASQVPYATLRESLMARVRAPLDRMRSGSRSAEESIWALKDVSFDVLRGEIVGVIGRNGAGKSTLLKVLSRITEPTRGTARIRGRVGSLLEVGTGFHPELTGRENIYLNGTILGMKRAEIKRQFDVIVAFAEVEQFVDTPVKHYSSGMYLRLAFAVAAHLEPEILLIDEVLAVGDASFQKKCLGKMGDVAKAGRTVLFVSHNLTAVKQLCPRCLLLVDGQLAMDGETANVVSSYLQAEGAAGAESVWEDLRRAPGNATFKLYAARIKSDGMVKREVDIDKEVGIEVEFWNRQAGTRNCCVNIYLFDGNGTVVLSTSNTPGANSLTEGWFEQSHPEGLFRAVCTLPANFLNEGLYYVSVYIVTLGPLAIEVDAPHVLSFRVFDTGVMREAGGGSNWAGVIRVRLPWRTELLDDKSGTEPLAVASG